MKVRVAYQSPEMSVDRVFTGKSAEEIVTAMQQAVAAELNFALRLVVRAMTPLHFAQEAVQRYNDATKKRLPAPQSCEAFLQQGVSEGFVTLLEK